MKLKARIYSWKYDFEHWRERKLMDFVWKLPKRMVYWSAIRVMANATTGKYSNQEVPVLLAMDALQRWDRDYCD